MRGDLRGRVRSGNIRARRVGAAAAAGRGVAAAPAADAAMGGGRPSARRAPARGSGRWQRPLLRRPRRRRPRWRGTSVISPLTCLPPPPCHPLLLPLLPRLPPALSTTASVSLRGGEHVPAPACGPRRPPLRRAAADGERALLRAAPSRLSPSTRPPGAVYRGRRPARASAAAAAPPPPPPVRRAVTPPVACVKGALPAGDGVFPSPFFCSPWTPVVQDDAQRRRSPARVRPASLQAVRAPGGGHGPFLGGWSRAPPHWDFSPRRPLQQSWSPVAR